MTINNYLKKERSFLLSSILALFSLVSCQKQPNLTFGNTYVGDNNGANIVVVDTSTVYLYTVVVDSTFSAGTGYLQVGKYNDPYLGTVTSRAYLQVAPPSTAAVDEFDQYDSIGLVMLFKKSNPFYGDTTYTQTLVVNQVDSLYQLGSFQTNFNSKSVLPLDPTALGQTNVMIAPNIPYTTQGSGDTVKIKLDDQLGHTLWNMIYNRSDTIFKSVNWLEWFHGLCISPGGALPPTATGNIFGFKDSAVMRIYYHKSGVYSTPSFIDFGITNKSLQFNNIMVDRGSTPLSRLVHATQNPQTPPATRSDSTGHAAYVQSITGLSVKLTVPFLNDIAQRQDYISVLRAQLTVRPDLNSFSTSWPLPPQLTLYGTNLTNVPIGTVNGASGVQNGGLVIDFLHPLNMVYTYDVTSFVKAQIVNTDPTAKQNGLLLEMSSPSATSSFARAVLADATYPVNQRVTLSVYYISLYPHN